MLVGCYQDWNNTTTNNNNNNNENDTNLFIEVAVFQLRNKWPSKVVITYLLLMLYCLFITSMPLIPY